jgi:hypothetical protein
LYLHLIILCSASDAFTWVSSIQLSSHTQHKNFDIGRSD